MMPDSPRSSRMPTMSS